MLAAGLKPTGNSPSARQLAQGGAQVYRLGERARPTLIMRRPTGLPAYNAERSQGATNLTTGRVAFAPSAQRVQLALGELLLANKRPPAADLAAMQMCGRQIIRLTNEIHFQPIKLGVEFVEIVIVSGGVQCCCCSHCTSCPSASGRPGVRGPLEAVFKILLSLLSYGKSWPDFVPFDSARILEYNESLVFRIRPSSRREPGHVERTALATRAR